jgi:tetratricopeptide (TPR) repeat protein
MISALLLAATLGALGDDGAKSTPKHELDAYQAAEAKTGKTAPEQVRLALWCEQHGLTAERMKHLALAVAYDPSNALARGLMGLVAYKSEWKKPDQLTRELDDDPARKARIDEYLERRAKVRDRADDLSKLAMWCERNGLAQQATAHYFQVLRLDPKRDAAWKHLGFKKLGGHWDKPERVAAAKAAAELQNKANKHWKPVLERWRSALQSKDASRRPDAEKALSEIKDPLAVPMVWATFGRGNPSLQQLAVQILSQIDDPSASRALVMLAVFSGSKDVRSKAIAELRRRDRREYAGNLIAMILRPIKYDVKPVGGPGKPGELLIKGSGSTPNLKRIYAPPGTDPAILAQAGDRVRLDENGLPIIDRVTDLSLLQTTGAALFAMQQQAAAIQQQQLLALQQQPAQSMITNAFGHTGLGAQGHKIGNLLLNSMETALKQPISLSLMNNPYYMMGMTSQYGGMPVNMGSSLTYTIAGGVEIPTGRIMLQAQKTAAMAQQQLDNDVESIKQYNGSLGEINDRVLPVLNDVSGLNLGPDPVAWQTWLNNLVGFKSQQASEPPTVVENVPLEYQPEPIALGSFSVPISVTRTSCFGAGTLVRALSGLQRIESLKVGDPVLTQSCKTGALSYKPILVVHHNPPSATYRITLGDEAIVSSYFHRFWKAGSGWVMARDLKIDDPIRTLNGTVKVTAIEEGKVVPVYNLDVADDADFFVGKLGALAHDNTLPNLREQPFDVAAAAATEPQSSSLQ